MTLLTEALRRILQTPHWARVTTTYHNQFGFYTETVEIPDNRPHRILDMSIRDRRDHGGVQAGQEFVQDRTAEYVQPTPKQHKSGILSILVEARGPSGRR